MISPAPAAPPDFVAEVERAEAGHWIGDLDLLAHEADVMPWASDGLRLIDEAKNRALEGHDAPRTSARVLLFTGHMIDAADREPPRFPSHKVPAARAAIGEAVQREQDGATTVGGIAGAASGGDILFHECCEAAGIPTGIYLALPRDQYLKSSVAPAGQR